MEWASKASGIMLYALRADTLVSLDRSAEGVWAFGFSSARLTIECPWRIVFGERVVLGASDDGHKFGHDKPVDAIKEAMRILGGKMVEKIQIDPVTADLFVCFSGEARLDAFNCSSGYEGWNFGANTGLSVVATGGGKLAIWEK
jgi:Family of unknown function (DUF6188)